MEIPRRNKNTKGNTNRDINAAQRAMLAIQLRAQKFTYDEVAQRCGYANRAACYNAVQRELSRIIAENVEALRREEASGLDELEKECWERLHNEKYEKAKLFAVDRILAIKERRAKMMGLDLDPKSSAMLNQVLVREMPQGYGLIEYPVTENK